MTKKKKSNNTVVLNYRKSKMARHQNRFLFRKFPKMKNTPMLGFTNSGLRRNEDFSIFNEKVNLGLNSILRQSTVVYWYK
jgi:hypothetical protein